MTTEKDGGPAFPTEVGPEGSGYMIQTGNQQWSHPGMSLREFFAAKAMQGLLARGIHYQTEGGRSHKSGLEECDIAGHAYAMADAMLKARES